MECVRNICAESRGEIAACSRRPLGSVIKDCFREPEIWLGMQKKRRKENHANRFTDVLQGEQRILIFYFFLLPFIALILHLFSVGLWLNELIWKKMEQKMQFSKRDCSCINTKSLIPPHPPWMKSTLTQIACCICVIPFGIGWHL